MHTDRLRRAFKDVTPPGKITQEAFDHYDRHLRRLARLRSGEKAQASDLWEYTQDLRYTEIQGPLFAYLVPFCLEAWRADLHEEQSEYGGFVEQFYPVLADCQVFEQHLSPTQGLAVSEFMRESILEEVDAQRGLTFKGKATRPYRWIGGLTTYGVLLPDIDLLWNAWWELNTIGRAVAVVQYVSCLLYPENENPVFAPWTPDAGGGPPCLWEFEGFLYAHRWLEPNVAFLKAVLNARAVGDVLASAVRRLVDQPEYGIAKHVLDDLALCFETLEKRCDELPQLLQTNQETRPLTWSS